LLPSRAREAIGANEMMMMRPLRRRRWTAISYGVIDIAPKRNLRTTIR
jgi:hypothetical protein